MHPNNPATRTSFTGNLPERIFSFLPLPHSIKCAIRNAHGYFRKYDAAAFSEPGTLNNQRQRERVVKIILGDLQPSAVVETGTYLGAGAKFFLTNTSCPVLSCEISPRYFAFCKSRFRDEPRIFLFHGDALDFLERIDSNIVNENAVFYLDAHWGKHFPLRAEVDIVFRRWPNALIIIDDFVVPHDQGYKYDSYGKHIMLNHDYLKTGIFKEQLIFFYPKIPSSQETGAKRGCCFICLRSTRAHHVLLKHNDIFVSH